MTRKKRVGRPLKPRDPNTIGGRIAQMREAKNMTIQKLADLTNLHPITLTYIESGKIKKPQINTLKFIADVLDIDVAWLAFGESEREHRPNRNTNL